MIESPLFNLNTSHRIVLASNSPRRKELLAGLGIAFDVKTLDVDEQFPASVEAEKVAGFLANKKGDAYKRHIQQGEIYITADTVVIVDGTVLNKPENSTDARAMLQSLSGKPHTVITGVAILDQSRRTLLEDRATVHFTALTDTEIDYYIDHYSPFDKAGAYGIQEWIGYIGVEKIEGSFYTVMGLPVHLVYKTLKNW
ncbi:Septum formation protein Maf [Lunatimonas lonarensis]|uniref:dTTP/UTP pyrophosphatase n=1 Tax=Lunatimonas lonarensis TaxID=1232681 RepID=R7ZLG6_9BACT|nr:Maf family nucleotide pyrophosphatase [Lunatimonas lonarensis]EON74941.1 Septum formation protein Maf [Lunatimonas lonarensis]